MLDQPLQRLARLVIRHSLAVRPGERIAIHGGSAFRDSLRRKIETAGANPILVSQSPVSANAWVFLESVGAGIEPGYADIGEARYVVVLEPGGPHTDAILRACFLDEPDPAAGWRRQHAEQAHFCERLSRVGELHIRTAHGTDLRIAAEGCEWINSAGQANMPDGEVFTAPIEDRIEGTAVLTLPSVYAGGESVALRLRFHRGCVVSVESDHRASMPESWLRSEASQVAEIGFGCNPAIDRFVGHPLFDEKRPGTFHVGLGRWVARPEVLRRACVLSRDLHALRIHAQGVPPHIDLIGDLGPGGGVWGDGELLVSGGSDETCFPSVGKLHTLPLTPASRR